MSVKRRVTVPPGSSRASNLPGAYGATLVTAKRPNVAFLTLIPSFPRTTAKSCPRSLRAMKSSHYREVTMKTQLQSSYVRLTTLAAAAASLASLLGAGWRP